MFNWFKKREAPVDNGLSKVQDHLKNSFSLVKKDISEVGNWVKELHENHKSHASKFDQYEKRLEKIEKTLDQFQYFLLKEEKPVEPQVTGVIEKESFDFNQMASSFSSLRSTEKEVFRKLSKLIREKGRNIHLKDLASEVYVGKDYDKVRTALANHITALEIFDFVYRQRIGREVYIALTEKGKKFVKEIDKELKTEKKATVKIKSRK